MKRLLSLLFLSLMFSLAAAVTIPCKEAAVPGSKGRPSLNAPFQPGEKLIYDLKWEVVPAGTATLEVLPMEVIGGEKVYHFAVTARSNEFVDKFYKVRDRIEAYADEALTHSVLYRKQQREGKRRRSEVVTFDWSKSRVEYSNFGKKREPIAVPSGTFDPLSVFYAFRFKPLRENMTLEAPVTDGKKHVMGKATVVGKERIEAPAGTFEAFLVEPELKDVGGVFEKSENAKLQVWITDDERRIPVRVATSVIVGSFVAELVSIERDG